MARTRFVEKPKEWFAVFPKRGHQSALPHSLKNGAPNSYELKGFTGGPPSISRGVFSTSEFEGLERNLIQFAQSKRIRDQRLLMGSLTHKVASDYTYFEMSLYLC
jgi:hypothetical protein